MRNARIWVLIADAASARICSTEDGAAIGIPAPQMGPGPGAEDDRAKTLCRAWHRAEGRNVFLAGPVRRFALYLGQILREAARERAYDGLVVVASPEIARHLDHALAPETRALLMGEIVRDLPAVNAAPAELREELWH